MEEKNVSKFGNDVLAKIKNENIHPKARWTFLLQENMIWLAGIISLIIGGISMAVLIYMYANNDWGLFQDAGGSFAEFFLATIPYFWIVVLAGFVWLMYYNFQHTNSGYKYSLFIIAVVSVSLSAVLGLVFYNVGLGAAIDSVFDDNVPYYHEMMNGRYQIWHRPERGMITGRLIQIEGDYISVIDVRDKIWKLENKMIPSGCGGFIPGQNVKIMMHRNGEKLIPRRLCPIHSIWNGEDCVHIDAERNFCPLRIKE